MNRCLVLVLAIFGPAAAVEAQSAAKPIPDAKPIANVNNDLGVAYLPARLRGAFEDRWVTMNVHWHDAGPARPCVLFVHGGGYGGGDMNGGYLGAGPPDRKTMELFAEKGYAVANLNYILTDGFTTRIFPQVFWDFKAAVRFLRANAAKYNIDPTRIGAVGFSAGGWLISTASYLESDDLMTRTRKVVPRNEYDHAKGVAALAKDRLLLVGLDDPRPVYADHSARLQAVSFDFYQHFDRMTPTAPATQVWLGLGGSSKIAQFCKKAGVDFSPAELTELRYKGMDVLHVPPMNSATRAANGKDDVELRVRLLEFFDEQLKRNPRTPAVEFRPTRAAFAERQTVEIVVPGRDVVVHFTTDGSEPTEASPEFRGTFEIAATTTIKAIARRAGERPSGAASMRYVKAPMPPTISDVTKLPKAKVGTAFSVTFEGPKDVPVVWSLSGHLTPAFDKAKNEVVPANGLRIDPNTGVLSGIPERAGAFTFQVQCAWDWGQIADSRTYVLHVEP